MMPHYHPKTGKDLMPPRDKAPSPIPITPSFAVGQVGDDRFYSANRKATTNRGFPWMALNKGLPIPASKKWQLTDPDTEERQHLSINKARSLVNRPVRSLFESFRPEPTPPRPTPSLVSFTVSTQTYEMGLQ